MAAQSKALGTQHVLVVDDDSEIVETIAATLRSRGMQVSTASDGNQAEQRDSNADHHDHRK